jgi:hypothetical protein
MREDSLERDTRALLVQLLHEQLGSQVELVDTTIANRREDYVVLLATHGMRNEYESIRNFLP